MLGKAFLWVLGTSWALVACVEAQPPGDPVDAPDAPDEIATAPATAVDPTVPIAPDLNANSANSLGELSGAIRSEQYPSFIWLHRDGLSTDRDSRVRLYAMKVVDRKLVPFTGSSGTYPTRVWTFNGTGTTVKNINWEDMTLGTDVRTNTGSSLYIGDIGNNNGGRNDYQVYQFAEPNPDAATAPAITVQATWRFQYPSSAQITTGQYPNCETMFFLDRYIYIITKESQPRIYRFPDGYFNSPGSVHTLVQVTNGSTQRIANATSNPSYGSFNGSRSRFVIGSHVHFDVFRLGANSFTGDTLVRNMLLSKLTPMASESISGTQINAEGATFELNTSNIIFGTESRAVYHWPAANYQ